jgi:hypothetical protein
MYKINNHASSKSKGLQPPSSPRFRWAGTSTSLQLDWNKARNRLLFLYETLCVMPCYNK